MFRIIFLLYRSTTPGFFNCHTHGIRNTVCIHDYTSGRISCSSPYRLYQRSGRSQKSFLVRIENCHQCNFGNIKTFSQKINPHQHIKHIKSHIPDYLCTFQRINIRMQILNANADFFHIIRQIFRHSLCQCCYKNLILLGCYCFDFGNQIINLPFNGTY